MLRVRNFQLEHIENKKEITHYKQHWGETSEHAVYSMLLCQNVSGVLLSSSYYLSLRNTDFYLEF